MSDAIRWSAPDLTAPAPPPPPDQVAAPELRLPSVEELQAMEESARNEGYTRGHAEGLASGQAEIRRIAAQMEGILDGFTRPLARLDAEVADALGGLAVRIAGELVRQRYEAEPELLHALVQEALTIVGTNRQDIELRLHPDDLNLLAPQLALPEEARLVADTTLSRGDLRLHTDSVRIDGSLSTRLEAALKHVMAGGAA